MVLEVHIEVPCVIWFTPLLWLNKKSAERLPIVIRILPMCAVSVRVYSAARSGSAWCMLESCAVRVSEGHCMDQRAHLHRNIRFGNNAWFSKALEDGKCGSQNNPRFSYSWSESHFGSKIDQKTHSGNQNQVHGPTDSFLARETVGFCLNAHAGPVCLRGSRVKRKNNAVAQDPGHRGFMHKQASR